MYTKEKYLEDYLVEKDLNMLKIKYLGVIGVSEETKEKLRVFNIEYNHWS